MREVCIAIQTVLRYAGAGGKAACVARQAAMLRHCARGTQALGAGQASDTGTGGSAGRRG